MLFKAGIKAQHCRQGMWPRGPIVCGRLLIIIFGGLLFLGCGYRLAGSGDLPGSVNTVAVEVLTNRSSETGIETTMTNALVDELTRRRQGLVVDTNKAEAVLSGTIESLGWDTIARKGAQTSLERKVYVVVSLALAAPEGKVLWQVRQLRAEQAYAVVEGDKSATETNRRSAINLLSQRLAELVYLRLTDAF